MPDEAGDLSSTQDTNAPPVRLAAPHKPPRGRANQGLALVQQALPVVLPLMILGVVLGVGLEVGLVDRSDGASPGPAPTEVPAPFMLTLADLEEIRDEVAANLPTAAFCATGSMSDDGDICCSAGCGACGGMECSERPGGDSQCCEAPITASGDVCTEPDDTVCMRPSLWLANSIDYLIMRAWSPNDAKAYFESFGEDVVSADRQALYDSLALAASIYTGPADGAQESLGGCEVVTTYLESVIMQTGGADADADEYPFVTDELRAVAWVIVVLTRRERLPHPRPFTAHPCARSLRIPAPVHCASLHPFTALCCPARAACWWRWPSTCTQSTVACESRSPRVRGASWLPSAGVT